MVEIVVSISITYENVSKKEEEKKKRTKCSRIYIHVALTTLLSTRGKMLSSKSLDTPIVILASAHLSAMN